MAVLRAACTLLTSSLYLLQLCGRFGNPNKCVATAGQLTRRRQGITQHKHTDTSHPGICPQQQDRSKPTGLHMCFQAKMSDCLNHNWLHTPNCKVSNDMHTYADELLCSHLGRGMSMSAALLRQLKSAWGGGRGGPGGPSRPSKAASRASSSSMRSLKSASSTAL